MCNLKGLMARVNTARKPTSARKARVVKKPTSSLSNILKKTAKNTKAQSKEIRLELDEEKEAIAKITRVQKSYRSVNLKGANRKKKELARLKKVRQANLARGRVKLQEGKLVSRVTKAYKGDQDINQKKIHATRKLKFDNPKPFTIQLQDEIGIEKAKRVMVSVQSSNVDKVGYSEPEQIMVVKFLNGWLYAYFSIPADLHEDVLEGNARCKTTDTQGNNGQARWVRGKKPSVGAAVWQHLRIYNAKYVRLS